MLQHNKTGLLVKISMPNAETPIMLSATQTPLPKNINKIEMKNIIKNNSVIIIYFFFLELAK